MDNFDIYKQFLAEQHKIVVTNNHLYEVLPSAKSLLKEAESSRFILPKFPKMERELSSLTQNIFSSFSGIVSVNKNQINTLLSQFNASSLQRLDSNISEIQETGTRELYIAEVEDFIKNARQSCELSNFSDTISAADYIKNVLKTHVIQLNELVQAIGTVKDNRINVLPALSALTSNCELKTLDARIDYANDVLTAVGLHSKLLQPKMESLSKLVQEKRFFPSVDIATTHLERATHLAERKKTTLSVSEAQSLAYSIDSLMSDIQNDLKVRQEERNKQIFKVIGIIAAVLFVLCFFTEIISIITGILVGIGYIIGGIITIWIILKILSNSSNNY